MATVSEIQARVGRMLGDETLSGYDTNLIYDALAAALDAIMPWVPKTAVHTITGDGSDSYTMPEDIYQVESVVIEDTGEILPQAVFVPGYYIGDEISGNNDWIEYPYGYIKFSKALTAGEIYTMYYLAHWTKPTSDSVDDDIEPPEYTHTGLVLYATAYMILPNAISAAEVRQFNTKVDSGNPEHNPMQVSANYLLRLFIDEMNRHPKYQKAQK